MTNMISNKPTQAKRKEHFHVPMGVFLIVALLILGGCGGALEIHQTINATGITKGYIDGTFDLTEIYEQQQASVSSYPTIDANSKGPICKQISEAINATDIACDLRNAILTFKGTKEEKQLNESDGFLIKRGWFVIEYFYRPNSTGLPSGNSSQASNLSQLSEFRANGLIMKYVIEMPGDIVDVVGGRITRDNQGKSVAEIDMMDVIIQGGTISVRSREFTALLGIIILGALALIAAMPLLSWLMNRREEKSVYKDKPGTLMYMFLFAPLSLIMFCAAALGFFIGDPGSGVTFVIGAFFFSMAFVLVILQYLGTDFEVTQKGIVYKTAFAKKMIPFSQIKKIERATAGVGFSRGIRPAYLVTTTSGTKVKPTHLEKGNGRRWHKGVLIVQKDGATTYYPVRDIGWVIDAVNERI